MPLHSLEIERHVIGGLIRNQEAIAEIEGFVKSNDFVAQPHSTIYSVLVSSYLAKETIDAVLLSNKIKNLGISFKDNIQIGDYIEAISFAPISKEATIKACQELKKLSVLRDRDKSCDEMKSHISKSINQPLNQTMSELDRIYSNQIEALDSDGEPEELFDNILELVEERGNSPQEVMGYSTPYEEFNKQYGGFRGGNIYAFASRTGQGKSTLLMDAASGTAKINKIKCLVLDTEMETTEVKFRTAAANSGVPLHFLETGKWRKNPDFIEKVRKNLKNLKQEYQTYHYYVGNKNVDEVCSIIRRWILNVVGRGNGAIVVYDYLKLTGEKLANNWAEHQAIGEKVDKLKRICVEFNFPLLTAIQINRTGTNSGRSSKDVVDDDSVISLSDRLLWFASFVAIFRRRTEDEIILDTPESGSHKCIVLKSRSDGIESRGHNTLIRRTFPDGTSKYVLNFLNFDIQNFKVEERGSLADSIMRQNAQHLVIDGAGSADERPL